MVLAEQPLNMIQIGMAYRTRQTPTRNRSKQGIELVHAACVRLRVCIYTWDASIFLSLNGIPNRTLITITLQLLGH